MQFCRLLPLHLPSPLTKISSGTSRQSAWWFGDWWLWFLCISRLYYKIMFIDNYYKKKMTKTHMWANENNCLLFFLFWIQIARAKTHWQIYIYINIYKQHNKVVQKSTVNLIFTPKETKPWWRCASGFGNMSCDTLDGIPKACGAEFIFEDPKLFLSFIKTEMPRLRCILCPTLRRHVNA